MNTLIHFLCTSAQRSGVRRQRRRFKSGVAVSALQSGFAATFLFVTVALAASVRAETFVTAGNGIRSTVTGQIKGTAVVFVSEIDGAVGCYKTDGTKLWHHASEDPAVMFEMVAADIDGDGRDDLLAASGDGHIHCWNADGSKRWKFYPGHKVRLSELAVTGTGKAARIFAGGNDYTLYEIDTNGKLMSTTPIEGTVRKIEAG
ncbi:hypothetical protein P4B35_21930, partial [Pontiellaceae bacterium B12227]|nr:hypothetical protein [Pontiellaceae bacterium B12227]